MYKTHRIATSKRTMALMLVVLYISSHLCCARNNLSAGLNVGLFKTYFYVYGCFARIYICVPPMCLVPKEDRREHQTHWRWNYGQSWATIWLLGIEPASSEKVTSFLNNWALSPARTILNCEPTLLWELGWEPGKLQSGGPEQDFSERGHVWSQSYSYLYASVILPTSTQQAEVMEGLCFTPADPSEASLISPF